MNEEANEEASEYGDDDVDDDEPYVFEDDEISFIKEVLLQQLVSEREQQDGGDRDVLFFAERCVNRAKQLHEERQDESSTKAYT